jgi:hypothetical protein
MANRYLKKIAGFNLPKLPQVLKERPLGVIPRIKQNQGAPRFALAKSDPKPFEGK